MPIRPRKVSAELRFNAGAESEILAINPGDRIGQAVTGLSNGNFVATWIEVIDLNFAAARLKAQLYNPLGFKIGNEFQVNTTVNIADDGLVDSEVYDVAALAGGGFVAVWSRTVGNGDIVFQRFSSTGAKLGGETSVAGAGDTDRESNPSVTALTNGQFVITWADSPGPGISRPENSTIYGTVYNANGTVSASTLGLANSFTTTVGGLPQEPEVTPIPGGGFKVTFATGSDTGDIRSHTWQFVSAGGDPFWFETSAEVVNQQALTGEQRAPSIATLSNGGTAVAYLEERNASDTDVVLRVYDDTSMVVNTLTLANTTSLEGPASVVAGKDGTFLVTWGTFVQTGVSSFITNIFSQLFTNAGIAVGDPLLISPPNTICISPSATALSDGRFVVSYLRGTTSDASSFHNYAQIIDGRDATLHGTIIADVIVGHDGGHPNVANTIFAFAGNDKIFGLGGSDFIHGGPGADIMHGGVGNDTYVVDNAGDLTVEAAAAGVDTVRSTVTLTLAANVENLALQGTANINAFGNASNNALTGNNGNNILSGAAGKDVLSGGLGNDLLIGGLGVDLMTGGAGFDAFVFNVAPISANFDRIQDFSAAFDTIRLENAIFTGLAAGALAPSAFRVGAAALDANDRVIYNQATGLLSFDSNGNAAGGVSFIANIANKPVLTAADFLII